MIKTHENLNSTLLEDIFKFNQIIRNNDNYRSKLYEGLKKPFNKRIDPEISLLFNTLLPFRFAPTKKLYVKYTVAQHLNNQEEFYLREYDNFKECMRQAKIEHSWSKVTFLPYGWSIFWIVTE